MKFGIRIPSLKRRIAARTSWKRVVRHNLGVKMPSGMGIITNPKKALYNKVYNRTSVSVDKVLGKSIQSTKTTSTQGSKISWLLIIFAIIFWPITLTYVVIKVFTQK